MSETKDTSPEVGVAESYKLPYKATKDTQWSSNPNSQQPTTGTVKRGEVVNFSRQPSSIGVTWQDAKLSDGSIKWVHPYDFEPA